MSPQLARVWTRRKLQSRLESVQWICAPSEIRPPTIYACSHHGRLDALVLQQVLERLGERPILWNQDCGDSWQSRALGALPFPPGRPVDRAASIRRTLRLMQEGRSVAVFGSGRIQPPHESAEFGRTLAFLVRHVPGANLRPVAIRYTFGAHERPEAYVSILEAVSDPSEVALSLQRGMDRLLATILHEPAGFSTLFDA